MLLRLIVIAMLAVCLAQMGSVSTVGLSAVPLAILMGMIYGNPRSSEFSAEDAEILRLSQQKLLRFGIVLYGFSLNFQEMFQVGWQAAVSAVTVIVTVITPGKAIGRRVLDEVVGRAVRFSGAELRDRPGFQIFQPVAGQQRGTLQCAHICCWRGSS